MSATAQQKREEALLEKIFPEFRVVVLELLQPGAIESISGTIELTEVTSSQIVRSAVTPLGDRLTFKIPYAGSSITWQVLFNSLYPKTAPDAVCEDPSFFPNVSFVSEALNPLLEWNHNDQKSLVRFIRNIVKLYTKYQAERAAEHTKLQEVCTNLQACGISLDNMEILSTSSLTRMRVTLKIDLPVLPLLEDWAREENAASLLINFGRNKINSVKLKMNPAISQEITDEEKSQIPAFTSNLDVEKYVVEVTGCLQRIADRISTSYELKRSFITTLLVLYDTAVVEANTSSYDKIVLYFTYDSLPVIVHIDLEEPAVPNIQPIITIFAPTLSTKFSGKSEMYSMEFSGLEISRDSSPETLSDNFHSELVHYLESFVENISKIRGK